MFSNRSKNELTNDNNYIRKHTTTKQPLNVEESSTEEANNADDATNENSELFCFRYRL